MQSVLHGTIEQPNESNGQARRREHAMQPFLRLLAGFFEQCGIIVIHTLTGTVSRKPNSISDRDCLPLTVAPVERLVPAVTSALVFVVTVVVGALVVVVFDDLVLVGESVDVGRE